MRIAVTAANGQLGTTLIRALKARPYVDVVAVARTPAKAAHLGVPVLAGDYDDEAQLQTAFQGIDAVMMVSGMAAPELRLPQHQRVIDAARKAGVKRVVFSGIVLGKHENAFRAVQEVSRQTEDYLERSGLAWVVGRNSIYIEPDIEFIDRYKAAGRITNCAGEGRCAYTSRTELSEAYVRMLIEDRHLGKKYTLAGVGVTQHELAATLNATYGSSLQYQAVSVEEYLADRSRELGPSMGAIITGIYQAISQGDLDVESHFEAVTGRPHQTPLAMMRAYRPNGPNPPNA